MKKLPLINPKYRYLEKSFGEWLDILGYAESTVYGLPIHVRELLNHLEQIGINNITELDNNIILDYYEQLKIRTNTQKGGALSSSNLNKHIQAIRKFTQYLRQVGRISLPEISLKNEQLEDVNPTYLTEEEIQQLFKSADKEPERINRSEANLEVLKSRDKAMLAIFYGCGARRNEGVSLNVGDINFDRAILHIRKGKRYKERLVPIGKKALKHLEKWVYDYRGEYLLSSKIEALFISERGTRLVGQSLLMRVKILQNLTENEVLQNKEIGLHTLRHSIATHLLQNGMKLESISRFLGHSSLESTQIYTHIIENEL